MEGTDLPVKVLTNHKGLEYFMSTKKLTPKQARWAEFFSEYNFVISYQSGKKNNKADALIQKSNDQSLNSNEERLEHYMQTLLPAKYFEHVANLQPIEKDAKDAENTADPAEPLAEPHAEPQADFSIIPNKIKEAN